VSGGFPTSQLGCRLYGNEVRKATGSSLPLADLRESGYKAAKLTVNYSSYPPEAATYEVGELDIVWEGFDSLTDPPGPEASAASAQAA
jgi:hypothetical protein